MASHSFVFAVAAFVVVSLPSANVAAVAKVDSTGDASAQERSYAATQSKQKRIMRHEPKIKAKPDVDTMPKNLEDATVNHLPNDPYSCLAQDLDGANTARTACQQSGDNVFGWTIRADGNNYTVLKNLTLIDCECYALGDNNQVDPGSDNMVNMCCEAVVTEVNISDLSQDNNAIAHNDTHEKRCLPSCCPQNCMPDQMTGLWCTPQCMALGPVHYTVFDNSSKLVHTSTAAPGINNGQNGQPTPAPTPTPTFAPGPGGANPR